MVRIDGKLLKNNLKKGWTKQDFANHCHISIEEFEDFLKKNFSEKDRKNLQKNSSHQNFKQKPVETNQTEVAEEQDPDAQLEHFKKQEQALRDQLLCAEKHCKKLRSSRKDCQGALREEKSFLDKIYQQIKERQETVVNLVKKMEKIDGGIASVKASKSELTEKLLLIQNSIKKLEKVVIKCYSDGKIECADLEISDYSEKFQFLTGDHPTKDSWMTQIRELAENLTMKEVKQLAKLLALLEILQKDAQNFEIVFEQETQLSALLELVDLTVTYLQ